MRRRVPWAVPWVAPITVLGFVALLTVMYGWVGTIDNLGVEAPERPEITPANQFQALPQVDNQADQLAGPRQDAGQLINNLSFPAGIGSSQIQLINNPSFPAGIGNSQIRLINQNQQNQAGVPYLGLDLSELTPAVARELNLPENAGVYVNAAVPGAPAQQAGLQGGDVLLRCDHRPVGTLEAVRQILAQKKAGDVVKLVVNRNGRERSFHVKIENSPMGLDIGAIQNPVWMGADIQDIDTVMKIKFNLPDQGGVIVTHVAPNSPASAGGLQIGDVVRRLGETRIRDVKQIQSLISNGQAGQQLALTILRDGQQLTRNVTLGRRAADAKKSVSVLPPAEMVIEGSWIGMDVGELSANDVADFGLPVGTVGILVEDVESPPATMVGFQTGDVITAVNGISTPDMKQFVAVTKLQSGAVVDVIRGNRHLFISVPPPGFTQGGTALNTGLNSKLRQVAMVRPTNGRVAILADGPDLNASISGNETGNPYVILVDMSNNAFAVLDANGASQLPTILSQHQVTAIICRDISPDMVSGLVSAGVVIYSGVVGPARDAIGLYQASRLVAMKGY